MLQRWNLCLILSTVKFVSRDSVEKYFSNGRLKVWLKWSCLVRSQLNGLALLWTTLGGFDETVFYLLRAHLVLYSSLVETKSPPLSEIRNWLTATLPIPPFIPKPDSYFTGVFTKSDAECSEDWILPGQC